MTDSARTYPLIYVDDAAHALKSLGWDVGWTIDETTPRPPHPPQPERHPVTIPVQLPHPLLCVLHLEDANGQHREERRWVAGFTEVDPSSEHPDTEDGLPLLVGDQGLRTPAQHANDLGARLTGYSLAWPIPQQPGGGLLLRGLN